MKILIIGKVKTGGGTEMHIAEVAGALRERGLDVKTAYLEDGIASLSRHILGADIVHFFLPRPHLIGLAVCKLMLKGKTIRIMSRRSQRTCYQTSRIRLIEKFLHKRTQILVGNSPAVCDELRQEAPKADIRLIRNGVNIKPYDHIPSPIFRMLCVANMFPYKGHDDLFAAIEQIRPSLPKSWMLNLAGRGTERFDWPGPDPHIAGFGYCKHVNELLAGADLFILPSHEEGSSNALLEAMMCGVPVIATDVGGNKDAVRNGETGLLVPAHSPSKLALAIQTMADNPDMRRKMALAAQLDVARRFSFERCVNEYEALYRSAA